MEKEKITNFIKQNGIKLPLSFHKGLIIRDVSNHISEFRIPASNNFKDGKYPVSKFYKAITRFL